MIINLWLALRDDAQALIKERVQWDEDTQGAYSGPVTNRQAKLFSKMHDLETTQALFRVDTTGGRDWTLWSVYFNENVNILQKIQDELDDLTTNYPNHIKIVGVWHKDGRQVGTQWVDPDDHDQGTTGTPTYPLHPRLIELMADIDGVGTRPVSVQDGLNRANILHGQGVRRA